MVKTIKLLISGYEASGKSTIASKIENALVINFDKKEYNFAIPHADFKEYTGMASVLNFVNEKITKYKEVYGEFPKFIIFDTVTQLYSAMTRHNSNKFTGFNIHSQNNTDTLDFNSYIEDFLIPNGMSIVIVAHTKPDEASGRHIIPAQGQFRDAGSWLSVVNDAIFIEKASGKLNVFFRSFKYPARTTIKDIQEKIPVEEFDINEYLKTLTNSKTQADKFAL
ncbi:hypothetical protein BWK51_00070 [Campylobacter fetus]|uniref:AAA family ATPase n=1 Tax=Campylobacter fetus TaxID=196 RepID=UPI000FCC7358|nr:AAA family ATPase [Campylobacter fetus]RUT51681.1 hypothetical protein BWK51_00070 [Campylobacter fetus]